MVLPAIEREVLGRFRPVLETVDSTKYRRGRNRRESVLPTYTTAEACSMKLAWMPALMVGVLLSAGATSTALAQASGGGSVVAVLDLAKVFEQHPGLKTNIKTIQGEYKIFQQQVTPAPVPATAPPSNALPEGAAPLPPGGLPSGWTMEQWTHYGTEYRQQQGLD